MFTTTTEHPDTLTDWFVTKTIQRGSMQAIEDKAIAEYMRVCESVGKEEAEETFFKHFNKGYDGSRSKAESY